MKVVGIITEFNPFHKGHEYIINKAKEITKADYCVVITSGNYVQRGEPAFVDKYTKTKIALKHGCDLCIELPVLFSTASAEYFSLAAVGILDRLGIIDYLAFGVENDNLEVIENIADILNNEQIEYKNALKGFLKEGLSFPKARKQALEIVLKSDNLDFIHSPNNILALEYIKALKKTNSKITPISIKRINASYHEEFLDSIQITDDTYEKRMYSASNIRKLQDDAAISLLNSFDEQYKDSFKRSYPIYTTNSFSAIAGAHLLDAVNSGANTYFDVPDYLWDKICNNISKYTDYQSFVLLLKSKEISYTAISRGLIHIVLGINKSDIEMSLKNNYGEYIKVLGFRQDASCLLTMIKERSSFKIITKVASYPDLLNEKSKRQFKKCIDADNIYRLCGSIDYKSNEPNEFTRKILTT